MSATMKDKATDKLPAVCEEGHNCVKRVRYFDGMVLEQSDLETDQDYHMGKRRRLARYLHGTGVICGLEIKKHGPGMKIEVTAGAALDGAGRLIEVEHSECISLEKLCSASDCKDGKKPVHACVTIRHCESQDDPRKKYAIDDDCSSKSTDYARWNEGYVIEVSVVEPKSDGAVPGDCDCKDFGKDQKAAEAYFLKEVMKARKELCEDRKCCSNDAPVVLGRLEIDCSRSQVIVPDNCIDAGCCRSYVWTHRRLDALRRMVMGLACHLEAGTAKGSSGQKKRQVGGAKAVASKAKGGGGKGAAAKGKKK